MLYKYKTFSKEKNIDAHLIVAKNAPTINKTRFFSSSKQILRVDEENKFSLKDSKTCF